MTDSWEYEKLVENQDDLARAMGANKGIALSVATKLVAKKVVSEAAKELADVRGPDVTERLRATSVINILLEEIKADPTVYYVFREALLSAGLTNGVVNKWMPAKPGNSEPTTTSTEGTTGAGSGAGNSEPTTTSTEGTTGAGSGAGKADKIIRRYAVDSKKILDLEDLVYVNAAMINQALHWKKIGGQAFEILKSRLDTIEANNPVTDVGKCLIEMLAEWLKNSRRPTWADVVKAIYLVDTKAAEEVAEKLKGGPLSLISESVPEITEGVEDSEMKDTDFPAIISALHGAKVKDKWLEIGLFLGISFGDLQNLKTKSDDVQVHDMVGCWMKWNYEYDIFGKPSWKTLVRAIGAPAGGNAWKAANKIADNHRSGQ